MLAAAVCIYGISLCTGYYPTNLIGLIPPKKNMFGCGLAHPYDISATNAYMHICTYIYIYIYIYTYMSRVCGAPPKVMVLPPCGAVGGNVVWVLV